MATAASFQAFCMFAPIFLLHTITDIDPISVGAITNFIDLVFIPSRSDISKCERIGKAVGMRPLYCVRYYGWIVVAPAPDKQTEIYTNNVRVLNITVQEK